MNVSMENIRKLMGWCPSVKITETESRISSANLETYGRPGGEKSDRPEGEKSGSNLSRMKRIGLLLVGIGSFVSALTLVMERDSISLLMIGFGSLLFLIGIVLYIKS